MDNLLNIFLNDIEEKLKNIDKKLKKDYILYRIKNELNEHNNNINLYNTFINIISKNNLEPYYKLEYSINKERKIILINQYYIAKDKERQKENNICLLNNIYNENIDKIILLNEEEYDLSFLMDKIEDKYKKKVKQIIIERRMRYYDVFNYVNTYYKNNIIIVSNLDIFFNESLNKLKKYNLENKFISLARYDLLNEYSFEGNNKIEKFIHEGPLGDPCIDSADSWIFEAPIKNNEKTKIMLGSNGCDSIINYILKYDLNYDVINPIDDIISIHYHLNDNRVESTKNNTRSYSENNIEENYEPSNYNHMYLCPKRIELCEKIKSFSTFCTKNSYKDLRLLLKSIELYHKDIPIYILCDNWVKNKIIEEKYDLQINIREELEKYTNMTRKIMEEKEIFIEFLLKKTDVIDYAMETNKNTLYIDSDIVLLNKLDLLIGHEYDVGLSPHNIIKEDEDKFGKYNAGFMYVKNKEILNMWRNIVNQKNTFDDQQALDYFEQKYKVFRFDDSYNFGWWRLFQCHDINKRVNSFNYDKRNVYYEFKTLKCVHTHFYEMNDTITIKYNKFIIDLLTEIKHPMLKYINNKKDIKYKEEKKEENFLNKERKKYIIIPKQPRNDFWNHNNDTFRELIYMWKKEGLCEIIEEDTKHVWYNKIGDILLYDRPTLDWLNKDINVEFNKILLGNPNITEELRSKGSNWIFWGRHPEYLEKLSKEILDYNKRFINSIFIGKIENEIQEKYRNKDWEKYIELYMMHKSDEEYFYSQEEYLNLLKQSKFGLCLRGFGGKCNREIELMGLGTVPIVEKNVNMNYYNNLIENKHYFRISKGSEIKEILNNCTEEKWKEMSSACVKWYEENCSCKGSFKVTLDIIEKLNKEKDLNNERIIPDSDLLDEIKCKKTDIFNKNNLYI